MPDAVNDLVGLGLETARLVAATESSQWWLIRAKDDNLKSLDYVKPLPVSGRAKSGPIESACERA